MEISRGGGAKGKERVDEPYEASKKGSRTLGDLGDQNIF